MLDCLFATNADARFLTNYTEVDLNAGLSTKEALVQAIYGISVDVNGNVYMTVSTYGAGAFGTELRKYNPNLSVMYWRSPTAGQLLAIDNAQNPKVISGNTVYTHSPVDGRQTSAKNLSNITRASFFAMSGAMYVYDNSGKLFKFNSMGDYPIEIPITSPWQVQAPSSETISFAVVGLCANRGVPILYCMKTQVEPGTIGTEKKIVWIDERTGNIKYSYTLPPGPSFPVLYLCTDSIYVYTKPLTGDLTGIIKIDKSAGIVDSTEPTVSLGALACKIANLPTVYAASSPSKIRMYQQAY